MLVSACFILFIAVLYLFFNTKNKFKYVILLHIISISLLMMVTTVYIYKLTSYKFSSLQDFKLYQIINGLRPTVSDISRLQNICVALFMFSALIFVYLFKKLRFVTLLLLCLPVLYFVIVNDPTVTWNLYFDYYSPESSAAVRRFITFNRYAGIVLFFLYSGLPLVLLVISFFKTRIRIRRSDSVVFFICLLLLDCFVYATFFLGSFKAVLFHHVDLLKFPIDSLAAINKNMFFPYSIVFIVLAVFILTIIFKPFLAWGFVSRREMVRNTQQMNQNVKMILHTYKNAFLGVERLTDLTNEYILSNNTEKAMSCTAQLNQIAAANLKNITHTIEMLKNINLKYSRIDIIDCIETAIRNSFLSEKITIIREYDTKASEKLETYGDYNHLQEVFINLLTNAEYALKYKNEAAPTITIKIISEADIFSIEIRDNGCGIEKSQIKNIFKSFYSTKSASNSFGVGLSYVQTVIKQHHGSITVKSEVNQYTSFQVVLPRYKKNDRRKRI